MTVKALQSLAKRTGADALILPFFEGKKPAFSSTGLSSLYSSPLKAGDFKGEKGEVLCHYPDKGKESRILLVGLGKEKEISKESLRRAYGKAIRCLVGKAKTVTVQLPETDKLSTEELTVGVVEGTILANYLFEENRTKKQKAISSFSYVGADSKTLKRTKAICDGVYFTRDLVIQNADLVTPTYLGKMAKEIAKSCPTMKATVMGREEIEKNHLHLLAAVARSSAEEPAFIVLEYKGAPKSKEWTALVGKGITYDTGGLNLKPTGGMETMRDDMAGSGAVLGTMHALATLKLPLNVVAVVASTENAIGPKSYKPGDIYQSHAGITVEVTNTDAEGRLALADALSYVQKSHNPTRVVDIATLTGGAVVTFGDEVSAVMGNDDAFLQELIQAGESTFERLGVLPLYEEYEVLLKSEFADIKNSGVRKASAIQGGTFLKRFVKDTKWAHIDIAGTAFTDVRKSYQPIHATGVGVRLFIEFLSSLCT